MIEIFLFIFFFIVLIFSVILHEISHGYVALHLGDPTAKYAGRLSLNPLKHLDPIGSVFLPLFLITLSLITRGGIIFGWAKPVPINPLNFRDQKYGSAKVAIAGPLSNFLIALIFGLILRFIPLQNISLIYFFSTIIYINLLLFLFNLLPIPPLDGSHILFTFLPLEARALRIFLYQWGFFLLLVFIFFGFKYLLPLIFWIYKIIVGANFPF